MSHTDGSGSVYGTAAPDHPAIHCSSRHSGWGWSAYWWGCCSPPACSAAASRRRTDGGRPRSDHGAAQPDRERTGTQPDDVRTVPHTEPRPGSGRDRRPRVLRGVGSGLCLGLDGDGEKAAAKLTECSGGPEQQWVVNAFGPDTVTLTNAAHNQCLDVEGGSGDDGARLQQFGCHGEGNQQWRLQPVDGGATVLVAVHSGKCAQARDGGAAAGTDIVQAPCDGNPAQRWTLQ